MLNLVTKALIKRQFKDLPEDKLEKIFEMIEKNPEIFKQLAETIHAKMKSGMTQEEAAKSLMEEGGDDIQKMLGGLGM